MFEESLTPRPELENPARMFEESLIPRPELENSQDPKPTSARYTVRKFRADLTGKTRR